MHRYTIYILSTLFTFSLGSVITFNTFFTQPTVIDSSLKINTVKSEFTDEDNLKITRANYEKLDKNLDIYLLGHEIEPYMVINNISGEQKNINVGNHRIIWIDKDKDKDKDNIKLKINNDVFTFKKYRTLNSVWGGEFEVGYFNQWGQIKLFKIDGTELIGINFFTNMCNGSNCYVSYYLLYDVKTKQKNFFGSYCSGTDLKLYDFNFDETIDFLGTTYVGKKCIEPDHDSEVTYNLFTLNNKGSFVLKKDVQQISYFFKQKFYEKSYVEFDEIFEQYWTENITMDY